MTVIGYAPGAFDLFHIGHLQLLDRARQECDFLVAGVVDDAVLEVTKGYRPAIPTAERAAIVSAIDVVGDVHVETSVSKWLAWQSVGFHRIFKGDDWRGTAKGRALEELLAPAGVEVRYFPYTMHRSSSTIRRSLASDAAFVAVPS
ncbi:MAG: cytidyltransferase [Myxococcales bacterium]|nr:MAG: cytidyltransferase [Myxococcales bacterium]